jgi:uncharacterized protein YegJ (DUF2314 family)
MPLACLAFVSALAVAQVKRDEDEVVKIERSDPDMTAALERARASLDEFLAVAANPPPGTSGFKLKVMIREGDAVEHFWVTPFRILDSGFEGVLANDPRVVKNVKLGQRVRFARADISDWGYARDGRQVGSYTVCVLFRKMPKEQADYYRKNHGFDC